MSPGWHEPATQSRAYLVESSPAAGVACGGEVHQIFMTNSEQSIKVGRYLISPLTKPLENGWYACSVSIRSGAGSAMTDRVLRLTRLFRDKVAAVEYAVAEGLRWVGHTHPAAQTA
jgi:hypothetical protein